MKNPPANSTWALWFDDSESGYAVFRLNRRPTAMPRPPSQRPDDEGGGFGNDGGLDGEGAACDGVANREWGVHRISLGVIFGDRIAAPLLPLGVWIQGKQIASKCHEFHGSPPQTPDGGTGAGSPDIVNAAIPESPWPWT